MTNYSHVQRFYRQLIAYYNRWRSWPCFNKYNAWNDLKTRIPNITFEQLSQLAPMVKSQVRAGLTGVKPRFEIVEVNHAKETKPEEDRQEDSDEKEDTRKTSAYTVCRIENHDVGAIIDTRAGGCTVSKNLLDRLG